MYDRPFRWWVQSVMPLVFDDSLSYYEVLAKLTKYIEGLTGDVGQIEKILATIEGIGDVTQFTEFLESIQRQIGDLDNLQTETKTSLVSAINEVALKADIAYWKPPTGIPESDLSEEVRDKLNRVTDATEYIINNRTLKPAPNNNTPTDLGLGTYTVPPGGIPWDTLSDDVKNRINQGGSGGTTDYTDLNNKPQINGHTLNAGNNTNQSLGIGTYSKPNSGIPETDLSAEVQEKLNTSGGIADSESNFVATRNYVAGELVYINGQLYRIKYDILAGTNLVPGNNIEPTDINAELEKINSEIEALQIGSGPDSWSLVANLTSNSTTNYVNFFEYFNATGGEDYLFICTPRTGNESPYQIRILKRDGTVVYTNSALSNTNQERFTFTPVDTGEYYCQIRKYTTTPPTESDAKVKVELEYTQSQGMTELWNKVNEAITIGEDVGAIETLVNQHTGQIEDLEDETDELKDAFDFNTNEYVPPIGELLGTPTYPSGWRPGGYNSTGGVSTSARYIRTIYGGTQKITCPKNAVNLYAKAPSGYYISIIEYAPGSSTGTRYGVANNLNGDGTNEVEIVPKVGYEYRFYIGYSANETVMANNLNDPQFMSQIVIEFTTEEFELIEALTVVPDNVTSNFTILCAKESNYADGTPTTVDWYLIADPKYQLYITKDFKTIKPIFAANYNILLYKFAVMKNGDIIAVYRSEIESSGSSDAGYRKNPFVYLASENWQIQHVVDFGSNLKPSGWLLNCGFCSMPNGDAMFAEYTRPSVETVNCWKISGDITNPSSWSVVKSFQQGGSATNGLEHFHYVMYDFYTNIYYISTGDDDAGSQLWYSTDNGETWTLAWQPSEKYCRSLNLIFTKDYIFWASDSSRFNYHYLFRCARDENGVMDFESVTELKDLYASSIATYGVAYLPRLNALVMMDYCDGERTTMPFKIYSIDTDEIYTMATLESATGNTEHLGFRTEYSEFYPNGNYVVCGFGIRLSLGWYYNMIKGLGNPGNSTLSGYTGNVNNLKIDIYKTVTGYGCELRTAFMPN